MKKQTKDLDMLEEYDFSKGVKGKYAKRYSERTNIVMIEPDVFKYFPDHDSVNDALRSLATIIEKLKKENVAKPISKSTSEELTAYYIF